MSAIAQIKGVSPAMLKKLEAEVRLVFSIAVKDHGFDSETADLIITSRGYATAITLSSTESKEEKKERMKKEKIEEKERLVKEKAEEKERSKQEKIEEKESIKQEKAEEKERIKQEKAAEKEKKKATGRGRPQKPVKEIVDPNRVDHIKNLLDGLEVNSGSESDCATDTSDTEGVSPKEVATKIGGNGGEPAAEPAEQAASEPAEQAASEPAEQAASEPAEQAAAEPVPLKKSRGRKPSPAKKEKEEAKERAKKEKEEAKERAKKEKEEKEEKILSEIKKDAGVEKQHEKEEEEEEEEYEEEEEEVTVSEFIHNGVTYLRDEESGALYDKDTQEPVGIINEVTGEIDSHESDEEDDWESNESQMRVKWESNESQMRVKWESNESQYFYFLCNYTLNPSTIYIFKWFTISSVVT